MTALSARAWPLSAARSQLLILCMLAAFITNAAAQNTAATAVPASFAVQPLYGELHKVQQPHICGPSCMPYNPACLTISIHACITSIALSSGRLVAFIALAVCKMEVKDLPQFEGLPSPEMEAGNQGIYAATVGMMDQWKMFQNGETADTSSGYPDGDDHGSDTGSGGSDGSDPSVVGSLQSRKPGRRSKANTAPAAAPVAAPAAVSAPVPVAQPATVVPAPVPAAAPVTARSYIISRPAAGSAAAYAAPAGAPTPSRRPQQRTGQNGAPGLAPTAAAPLSHRAWGNASSQAVALEAGAPAYRLAARRPVTRVQTAAGVATSGLAEEDDYERPPMTSPTRRLFAANNKKGKHVCNKGTPTNSTTGPVGRSSFSGKVSNIVGITMADSGVVPADAAIAVGPNHVVHVVNSLVKIMPVNSNGEQPRSLKPGQMRLIPLPDWFGLVASPCDGGYITPSATYDKEVGRFLISAICGGDTNQVLLSVSADDSAMGTWILYSFAGEATQGTRMQCVNESYPISFHSQVRPAGKTYQTGICTSASLGCVGELLAMHSGMLWCRQRLWGCQKQPCCRQC